MIIMLYYKLISFPNKHPIKPRKYLNSKLECAIPFQLSKFPVAPPPKPRLSVCLHFTFNNHLLVYLSVCYRKTNGEGKESGRWVSRAGGHFHILWGLFGAEQCTDSCQTVTYIRVPKKKKNAKCAYDLLSF